MVLWIVLSLCLIAHISIGTMTLRKGHSVVFAIGIMFPILSVVGALMAPTPRAAGPL
jgi:predicted Co/Zn/Cd cation transporter (cation efflux family)